MTLSELIAELSKAQTGAGSEDGRILQGLIRHIQEWIAGDSRVVDLAPSLDRFLGYSWLSTNELHGSIVAVVSKFTNEIPRLPAMTVNERLFVFGLLHRYDAAISDRDRQAIRSKVDA